MATRFTETAKWVDPWFRRLKASEKLVFLYLIENCDNAGFFEVDYDMMSFQLGLEEDRISRAIKGLIKGLIIVDDWMYVRNFLKHQKNWPLNPENNAHKQIINIIKEKQPYFKGNKDFTNFTTPIKGLNSPPVMYSNVMSSKGKGVSKGKRKVDKPGSVQDVIAYFKEKGYSEEGARKAWAYYDANDWHDSKGNPVLAWKQKVFSNWMKPEYKETIDVIPSFKTSQTI